MTASPDERLQTIVQHAYQNAPAVRALLDGAGLSPDSIRGRADLDRIPVTTRDRLIELQRADPPYGGLLAVPAETLRRIYVLPGPLYVPHADERTTEASLDELLDIAGVGAGDVVLGCIGYHLGPFGLILDRKLREHGAAVIPAGVGSADLQVGLLRDLQVTTFAGTPSWLMALLERAAAQGLDARADLALRKAIVSGEPMAPALRQHFVEACGLTVTNLYGMGELGGVAWNQTGGFAMRLLDTVLVQVANPETGASVGAGEVGEVVITTFNPTFPLIRFGTGDMAINVDPAPGTSEQRDRSLILVGRIGDAVKVRGLFVHPNQLRFALTQVAGVQRAQGVVSRQGSRDNFTLRAVLGEGADAASLEAALRDAIRSTCRVTVDHILFVPADELAEDARPLVDERTWQ